MTSRPHIACWIALALVLALMSAGCSVRRVTYNETIAADRVQFIRTGQTTLQDIVDKLGAPEELTEADSGVIALYNWSDTKSAALDFGALFRLFSPYSPTMTLAKTGIAPEQFMVVFDPQWTVRAYGFSRWPKDKDNIIWFWPF
jgi:hypothetical protein